MRCPESLAALGAALLLLRGDAWPVVLEVPQPSVLRHVNMPPVDLNANTRWHRVKASPSKQMRWIWGGQADMVK